MRLLVWNCAGKFRVKAQVVLGIAPDIAILSEAPSDFLDHLGGNTSGCWLGASGEVGVAVAGFGGWGVSEAGVTVAERYFLPTTATKDATSLQIVGACIKRTTSYTAPTRSALRYLSEFIQAKPSILAGDFNQSVMFDKKRPPEQRFMQVLQDLRNLGLRSAWHENSGEDFGAEATPTLYWRWQRGATFHIDYAFVSDAIKVHSAHLGSYDQYVASGLSDHVPLVVELDPC